MDRQIRILRKNNKHIDIVAVVGFQAERIKSRYSNIHFVENEDYKTKGLCYSINRAFDMEEIQAKEKIAIIYGDLVFNDTCASFEDITSSFALIDSGSNFGRSKLGVNICEGTVQHFAFGLKKKWCQIIFLTGKELTLFKEYVGKCSNCNRQLFEAFNYVIDKGGLILSLEKDNAKIMEIDTQKDIGRARATFYDSTSLTEENTGESIMY